MSTIFTQGRFSAEDATGAPLVGGLLHTYSSGTTTPKATYSDPGLTAANANPITNAVGTTVTAVGGTVASVGGLVTGGATGGTSGGLLGGLNIGTTATATGTATTTGGTTATGGLGGLLNGLTGK